MGRKIFYLLFLALLSLTAYNQEINKYVFTIGIYTGFDHNINGYRMSQNNYGNDFYAGKVTGNIGIDYGLMISEKFRPRIEFKYLKMRYNAGWENGNISAMKETTVYLHNFDVNLRMDYLLVNKPKFQIFVSPAVKWEFNAYKDEKNLKIDGTYNWAHYNEIITENPSTILGGAVSSIFKYNVTKKIAVTLTPEYTIFFRNFVKVNDKSYQRTSVSVGLEFNFY